MVSWGQRLSHPELAVPVPRLRNSLSYRLPTDCRVETVVMGIVQVRVTVGESAHHEEVILRVMEHGLVTSLTYLHRLPLYLDRFLILLDLRWLLHQHVVDRVGTIRSLLIQSQEFLRLFSIARRCI